VLSTAGVFSGNTSGAILKQHQSTVISESKVLL